MSPNAITILAISMMLTACGPKRAPVATGGSSPFAATPHLPNPRAGSYARVIQSPTDPAVAAVIADRRWDASLSGTAAGLALRSLDDVGGFSRREIREAAWQAGYPYPISHLAVWQAQPKTPPPSDVQVWLSELSQEMDVGLVRARNGTKELWVGLAAHPLIDLGVIPRETALQTPLKLPIIDGAQLTVSSPLGQERQNDLSEPLTVHLDSEGEWLFAITDQSGDLARFTVYAGVAAPSESIIEGPAIPISNDEAAKEAALNILADARQVYGLLTWTEDPYLSSNTEALKGGGTADEDAHAYWECTGRTVEDCVDQMLWIPEYRATLLNPDAKYVGVSGRLLEDGVALWLLIANE